MERKEWQGKAGEGDKFSLLGPSSISLLLIPTLQCRKDLELHPFPSFLFPSTSSPFYITIHKCPLVLKASIRPYKTSSVQQNWANQVVTYFWPSGARNSGSLEFI